ncbi:MAG: hypothetical protein JXA49_00130 [Actinobacteria bacterium]|nr:hypothetical protein [Actinomycetota bacterium]
MPANSRKALRVNDYLQNRDISTQVTGDKPIIMERAMYWSSRGAGTAPVSHVFCFAEDRMNDVAPV